VHFSAKKILLKIEGSADDILAISVWELVAKFCVCFADFDERHKNEKIANLSLSLLGRQAGSWSRMTMWIREKEESIGNDGK